MLVKAGQFADQQGLSWCGVCGLDKFSSTAGAQQCDTCPPNSQRMPEILLEDPASVLGTRREDCLCKEGYFLSASKDEDGARCVACPSNAICTGADALPRPVQGFWHDASEPAFLGQSMKRCHRDLPIARKICRGATNGSSNYQCYSSAAALEACALDKGWATSFASSSSGGASSHHDHEQHRGSICRPRHEGIRCSVCETGTFKTAAGTCHSCGEFHLFRHASYAIERSISILLFVVLVTFIVWHLKGKLLVVPGSDCDIFMGTLHSLWPQIQITASIGSTLQLGFPETCTWVLNTLGALVKFSVAPIASFVPMPCVVKSHNYFTSVLACTIFPIFVIVALGLADLFQSMLRSKSSVRPTASHIIVGVDDSCVDEMQRVDTELSAPTAKKQRLIHWVYLYTFFAYAPICGILFPMYSCERMANGESWLRIDSSIQCGTYEYKSMLVYTSAMVLLFPIGIPLFYFWQLYTVREKVMKRKLGEHDESLSHLTFLFQHYKAKLWWFEVADCFRRAIFTGLLIFVPSEIRSLTALALAFFSQHLFHEIRPFVEPTVARITDRAQWIPIAVFMAVLVLQLQRGLASTDTTVGFILAATLIVVLVFSVLTQAHGTIASTVKSQRETEANLLEYQFKEYEIKLSMSEMQADLDRLIAYQQVCSKDLKQQATSFRNSPDRKAALIVRPSFRGSHEDDSPKPELVPRITRLPSIAQQNATAEESKMDPGACRNSLEVGGFAPVNPKLGRSASAERWAEAMRTATPREKPRRASTQLPRRSSSPSTPPPTSQALRKLSPPSPLGFILGAKVDPVDRVPRSYPCFVISVKNLRTIKRIGPYPGGYHEDVLDKLERLTASSRSPARSHTYFVSHNWDHDDHPDNEHSTKLRWLQNLNKHLSIPEETDIWLWWDYLSVPQKDEKKKRLAIESINSYATLCSRFLPIVRDADEWENIYGTPPNGGGEAMRGSLEAYQRRTWCRFEVIAALCPKQSTLNIDDPKFAWRQGPANLRFRYHHNPSEPGCGERLNARHLLDPREGDLDKPEDMEILKSLLRKLASLYDDYEASGSQAWDLTIDVSKRPRWLKRFLRKGGGRKKSAGALLKIESDEKVLTVRTDKLHLEEV